MGAELPEEVEVGALWATLEQAADLAGLALFIARIDPGPPAVLYSSRRLAALIDRGEPEQLVGMVPWAILRAEDQPAILALASRPAGAPPIAAEVQIERPDGELIPILLTTTRMVTSKATLTFGYVRDLRAQRATEAKLAASEARFQFLLQQAPDAITVSQRDKIVYVNPAAKTLVGAVGSDAPMRAGLPTATYRIPGEPERQVEMKSVPIDWEGEPAVLTFTRDITERKAIEDKLAEAERLAALGKLAAEVAHEINNPLTYVQLTAQRLDRTLAAKLPPDVAAAVRDQFADIRHGLVRIASITAGLRASARADEAVAVEPAPPPPTPPPAPAVEARRRVLVIDDEPLVRGVLAKLLADAHAVTPCASGEEGLALLATTRFDVILCDVMMPGMNGREVYRRIAAQFPGLERRIVFVSGGTFAPDLEQFLDALPNPKIAKPFRLDEVLSIVEGIANSP